ncbi:hypothetical protein M408DRAFT_332928 [Serendipita vermifera MAFF 305830]|uniref:NADP-dependent oxidoreductase domain-containing protein n=1 Tax=Serendipita vermifera MAFF 305830 TaxID=933852 RepID=A0A0C2W7I6_SERVB|nr:hypothetical protein M408DRAFT_332928 [Serendipita vermifera MAFF 305830]
MPIGTTLLADGRRIPNLAFGTGSVLKNHDAQAAVKAALDSGFRHVDTAQFYNNEESVGNALREWLGDDSSAMNAKRDQVWVTTKYSGGEKGPLGELTESLGRLDLEYVDLYLIHGPWFVSGHLKSAWREMEEAQRRGLAKSIGVSNFEASDLKELLKVAKMKPVVNQIHLHPYIYHSSLATLNVCHEHGIVVEAYGSLFPITQQPDGPVTAALKGPSKRLGASPGQVLFLWVRAKGAVVVTTTNKEERLKEYLQIGELGSLTGEEVRSIDAAAQAQVIVDSSALGHKLKNDTFDVEKQDTQEELAPHEVRWILLRLIVCICFLFSTHLFGAWITGVSLLCISEPLLVLYFACLVMFVREMYRLTVVVSRSRSLRRT